MTSGLDPKRLVREEVRALKVYHLDLEPCLHKLDQNEVPYDLPRAFKRRVADRIVERSWARYPDFHADAVRELLAERHDWPFEGILVGNGSNELLGVTLEAVARPGDEVLVPSPSFGLYRMFVERAAARPRFLQGGDDLQIPIDDFLEEVERDPTRPVILCTPNNPTGDAVSAEAVEALLERLEAPLLLDNAYGEFCTHDYRPLLRKHRHLVIFRTFSKAWSLGGLRLGYLLGDPALVGELIKVKLPYNVGYAHAAAAEAVLAEPAAAERRVRAILARRPQWAEALAALGLEVFLSEANFHLVRVPEGWARKAAGTDPETSDVETSDVEIVRLGLEARSIRVRNVSGYPGLDGCLRISVGSGRALRDVVAALESLRASILEESIR